jgi:nitroimidazol reductase NimA-like FMN-containing flavoprotein (pyridoxamine 5'-phosphate oxidase superfamily)
VFGLTLVKLRKMKKSEIDALIQEQILCRIAFKGERYPYIAPFQYIFTNGHVYFNFTNYGRKMKLFEEGNPVCVEIEKYTPNMSEYRFVVLTGKLKVVTDPQERARAIEKIAEVGKQKLSTNFLAAHGFKKEAGWSSLTADKPLIIVKLDDIIEELGLKSP